MCDHWDLSLSEIELQNLTHCLYVAWCGWYVASRAHDSPHYKQPNERQEERMPFSQMDFFLKKTVCETKALPYVSGVDCSSGAKCVSVVAKNSSNAFTEGMIHEELLNFDVTCENTMQVDPESAIVTTRKGVAGMRKTNTFLRKTPKGSDQWNAYVEEAHRALEGLSMCL